MKNNMKFLFVLLVLPCFSWAQSTDPAAASMAATAPSGPPAAKPTMAKVTKTAGGGQKVQVSFDDEMIHGDVDHPSLDYLSARKSLKFRKMIKLREDFIPEADKGKVEFGISQ